MQFTVVFYTIYIYIYIPTLSGVNILYVIAILEPFTNVKLLLTLTFVVSDVNTISYRSQNNKNNLKPTGKESPSVCEFRRITSAITNGRHSIRTEIKRCEPTENNNRVCGIGRAIKCNNTGRDLGFNYFVLRVHKNFQLTWFFIAETGAVTTVFSTGGGGGA